MTFWENVVYRPIMGFGAIFSFLSAVSIGLLWRVWPVSAALLACAVFFVWAYHRGLPSANDSTGEGGGPDG